MEEKNKHCPEYCPFLKASNTFCELFKRNLQTGITTLKCPECLNPVQRHESYAKLGLTERNRIEMWQKAVLKHNEIELSKKREEEGIRKKFTEFLEDKFSGKPPLDGNTYIKNIVINLFMVMDATERSMMMAVLSGKGAEAMLMAIERAPKDESLLRNVRQELYANYKKHENTLQSSRETNVNNR